jgi:ribonuclease P protein component
MISRQHRFHGYNSLSFVYRKGQAVRNQHISLKYVLNSRRSSYRAAIIVSRKVQKSATARNLIRRRLYEIIRSYEADINGPYDLIVTVFSEQIADWPDVQLRGQITELLERAGIVGGQPKTAAHVIVKANKEGS